MKLPQRVRALREKKGWTQNHLAVVSKVSQPVIWRLENGLIRNPTASVVQRVARALEVSADFLLREEGHEDEVTFDEILRHDPVGQAVFRGYEDLTARGREQVRSFVDWLRQEEEKKRRGKD